MLLAVEVSQFSSEQGTRLLRVCGPQAANAFEEMVATWDVCVRVDGKGKDSFAKALKVKTSSMRLC